MLSGLRRAGSAKRSFEGAPRSECRVGYRYLAFEAPSWSVCMKQLSLHIATSVTIPVTITITITGTKGRGEIQSPAGYRNPLFSSPQNPRLHDRALMCRAFSGWLRVYRQPQGCDTETNDTA